MISQVKDFVLLPFMWLYLAIFGHTWTLSYTFGDSRDRYQFSLQWFQQLAGLSIDNAPAGETPLPGVVFQKKSRTVWSVYDSTVYIYIYMYLIRYMIPWKIEVDIKDVACGPRGLDQKHTGWYGQYLQNCGFLTWVPYGKRYIYSHVHSVQPRAQRLQSIGLGPSMDTAFSWLVR